MGITGIILAGGKSSRMGTNKALLPVGQDVNIQNIIRKLHNVTDDVLIVTNTKEEYGFLNCPMVSDNVPGKGPLAGLEAGLSASKHNINAVVACDMPFVSPALLQYMLEACEGFDAVVPRIDGRVHPLFAVYRKTVLPVVRQCLKQDQLRIMHLLSLLCVRYIEEEDIKQVNEDTVLALFNMNHPEDYEKAKNIAAACEGNVNKFLRFRKTY
jgi:molybdopterin-guanine dinucleotide biosynthesis protein A